MGALISRFRTHPACHIGVMSAIEDIQKLSDEDMLNEFDRIFHKSEVEIPTEDSKPCEEATESLLNCMRQNPNQLDQCFNQMDEFRKCVLGAYKERIEEYLSEHANESMPPPTPGMVPVMPFVPQEPQIQTAKKIEHKWYKFWKLKN